MNGIPASFNEEDRETVILEKFDFKKEKTSLSVDGIQFALHFGLYKLLKILLNKVSASNYLEDHNHKLLEQAVLSGDEKQLKHVIIQIYEYEGVQIVLPSLSDEAFRFLHTESWTQDTIEVLYPYTSSYFIPLGQKKAMMNAFVCYNTFDVETANGQKKRYGAKDEADRIIDGFQNCGFTVRGPRIDWTFDELLQHLEGLVDEVKDTSSCILICIMTHGDQGVIYDKDGKVGEINKILNISYQLKDFLPVVR